MKTKLTRLVLMLVSALALVGALLLAGCGDNELRTEESLLSSIHSTSTSAALPEDLSPEIREVNLIMDWMPWVLDIPIDVAQAKGFYEAEGLAVEQTIPTNATDVAKFVATGKSQFGLYYSPDILMALNEGAPLLSIGSLMAHAPVGIALKPGFTAESPQALAEKVVSIPLIPSTRASFATMLATAGVDPTKVQIVDPGYDLITPLLTGTCDAAALTEFGELVEVQTQGEDPAFLDFRDWGTPDFAFLNLITTQDFAQANPNTTRAFVRATYEGLAYAAAHPDEAVELYVNAHPELKADLLLAQWKAAIPALALVGDHPAGWQDLDSWKALSNWMMSSDLIKEEVDLETVVTNDYLIVPE